MTFYWHLIARPKNVRFFNGIWMQWGSEIRPFKIWKHLKYGLFEGQISNGTVFKCSGFSNSYAIVSTIKKPDLSKSGHFSLDFKWFLTNWQTLVWISKGWASRFQIPFEIRTICNPTSFWPFKIQSWSISHFFFSG